MTQNDIAYYNARKEAKDARLRRRETKRHNLASEAADATKAAASYLSAQSSQISAAAAQKNADTNRATYELEWSKEYGSDYGSSPDTGYLLDVTTGEKVTYDDSSHDRINAVSQWVRSRPDDIIVTIPTTKNGVPQSYMEREMKIADYQMGIRLKDTQSVKNTFDAIKSGAGTVQIIVDTAKEVVK